LGCEVDAKAKQNQAGMFGKTLPIAADGAAPKPSKFRSETRSGAETSGMP
jgi:hypothetical protein